MSIEYKDPAPCQPRTCVFTIPATVEQAWRRGDRDALADHLRDEIVKIAGQTAADYDARWSARVFTA